MTTFNGTPAAAPSATPTYTEAESLVIIRNNILARLREITASPKPNYNIDGQSVSWQSYFDSLMAKVDQINVQINASEPFEFVSRGYS